MAFATIDGGTGPVTIPVAIGSGVKTRVPIGVAEPAFDGDMRSSVRGYRSQWAITTRLITVTVADSLRTELEGAPPISLDGDIVANTATDVIVLGEIRESRNVSAMDAGSPAGHVVLEFVLREETG